MTGKTDIWFIIMVMSIIVAAFIAGRCTCDCEDNATEVITHIDTVTITSVLPPDTVTILKPKLVFRRDTIIDSSVVIKYRDTAWTASDKVVTAKNDTVHTDFLYPEMMFKHRFNYSTDSMQVITIFKDKIIVKQRPWWEIPASVIGGVAAGYIFGRIK